MRSLESLHGTAVARAGVAPASAYGYRFTGVSPMLGTESKRKPQPIAIVFYAYHVRCTVLSMISTKGRCAYAVMHTCMCHMHVHISLHMPPHMRVHMGIHSCIDVYGTGLVRPNEEPLAWQRPNVVGTVGWHGMDGMVGWHGIDGMVLVAW